MTSGNRVWCELLLVETKVPAEAEPNREESPKPLTLREVSQRSQRAILVFFGALVAILFFGQALHLSFLEVAVLLLADLGVYLWFALRWLRGYRAWQRSQHAGLAKADKLTSAGWVLLAMSLLFAFVGVSIMLAGLFNGLEHVYATTGGSLVFIGFLFLPIIGAITWLRPASHSPATAKVLSYLVILVISTTIGYWSIILIVGLTTPLSLGYIYQGFYPTAACYGLFVFVAIVRLSLKRQSKFAQS